MSEEHSFLAVFGAENFSLFFVKINSYQCCVQQLSRKKKYINLLRIKMIVINWMNKNVKEVMKKPRPIIDAPKKVEIKKFTGH